MPQNVQWWKLMRETGHTAEEITDAMMEAEEVRKGRRRTAKLDCVAGAAKAEEVWGSAGRKVKRLFG